MFRCGNGPGDSMIFWPVFSYGFSLEANRAIGFSKALVARRGTNARCIARTLWHHPCDVHSGITSQPSPTNQWSIRTAIYYWSFRRRPWQRHRSRRLSLFYGDSQHNTDVSCLCKIVYQSDLRSIRSIQIVFDMFDRFDRFDIKKRNNFEMPLLKKLSRSSQDSFESESDLNESWDDRLNSAKRGKNEKCHFWRN